MMVTLTIRYFAAARAAAGIAEESFEAATPREAFDAAAAKHGAELERIITISSYLIDGTSLSQEDVGLPVLADAVIDVLPPFAGG